MLLWWLDDDPDGLAAVRYELEQRNVIVRTFELADDLLAAVGRDEEAPVLVITDLIVQSRSRANTSAGSLFGGLDAIRELGIHPRSAKWPVLIVTQAVYQDIGRLSDNVVGVVSKGATADRMAVMIAGFVGGAHSAHHTVDVEFHLLSDLIHRLRASLTGGHASIRLARQTSGKRQARALDEAELSMEQATAELERARLIDGLSHSPRIAEVGAPAEAVLQMARIRLDRCRRSENRPIEVYLRLTSPPDDHRRLAISASALNYVLCQLIGNAFAYCGGKGPSISTRVTWTSAGATVTITNSGTSFRPDELDRVGTLGWRGQGAWVSCPGGSGAGLWLVKKLLQRVDGQFDFRITEFPPESEVSAAIPWSS